MAGPLDHQFGCAVESTYGTPVTVTRFFEWDLEGSEHSYDPKVVQGSGMQVGDGGIPRADRSVSVVGQSSGTVALDVQSKGMGLLFKGALGTGASTLVAGTTYQQLFTTGMTTALLDAFTFQYGVVRADAPGTVDAYTYPGCTITDLELSCAAGDVLKAKFGWDGGKPATATPLASASYPSLGAPFHFGQGSVTVGGSVTVPTTTALASGGTAVTSMREFTLTLPNNANTDRWRFGGRNQPRVARREPTMKTTLEYDSATIRDNLLAHDTVPVVVTFTSSEALSTGNATLQVVAPACKVVPSSLPKPSDDPVYDVEFRILKPTTGAALYVVLRTSDSAL